MRFFKIFVGIFSVLTLASALDMQGDGVMTSTSTAVTAVWVTITTNGVVTTPSSIFTQTFIHTYTAAESSYVKSGDIGLGTYSGSVGGVRTYDRTTIGQNGAVGSFKPENIYSGIAGIAFLLIGALL